MYIRDRRIFAATTPKATIHMTTALPFRTGEFLRPTRRSAAGRLHRSATVASQSPGSLVGRTPVLRVSAPLTDADRGFWAKLEGFNPGGGMKDRPAMHMVEMAQAREELRPGARIVESTSGTLGLGLALAGMVHRHPVTLVTDPGMEPIVQRMLAAYGADVDLVRDPHPVLSLIHI